MSAERVKMTPAQRRALEHLGRPGTHSCAWGHTYKPPQGLVAKGLARHLGYRREGPVYQITLEGRAVLAEAAIWRNHDARAAAGDRS